MVPQVMKSFEKKVGGRESSFITLGASNPATQSTQQLCFFPSKSFVGSKNGGTEAGIFAYIDPIKINHSCRLVNIPSMDPMG